MEALISKLNFCMPSSKKPYSSEQALLQDYHPYQSFKVSQRFELSRSLFDMRSPTNKFRTDRVMGLKLSERNFASYTNCLVKTRECFESFNKLSDEDIDQKLKKFFEEYLQSFVGLISSETDYTCIQSNFSEDIDNQNILFLDSKSLIDRVQNETAKEILRALLSNLTDFVKFRSDLFKTIEGICNIKISESYESIKSIQPKKTYRTNRSHVDPSYATLIVTIPDENNQDPPTTRIKIDGNWVSAKKNELLLISGKHGEKALTHKSPETSELRQTYQIFMN